MARQINSRIEGVFDGIHYYKWRDRYCKRVMPVKERLSKRTLEEAEIFGKANKLSGLIRKTIKPVYESDRSLMYRMNTACAVFLRTMKIKPDNNEINSFSGFELNIETSFDLLVPVKTSLIDDQGLHLVIPTCRMSDFSAPANTRIIIWNIMVCAFNIETMQARSYSTRQVAEYSDMQLPEKQIPLPLEVESGELVLVIISCCYSTTADKNGIVKDINWRPARILSGYLKN